MNLKGNPQYWDILLQQALLRPSSGSVGVFAQRTEGQAAFEKTITSLVWLHQTTALGAGFF
jgi:hypothetical protein